jgi:hypothetical protein
MIWLRQSSDGQRAQLREREGTGDAGAVRGGVEFRLGGRPSSSASAQSVVCVRGPASPLRGDVTANIIKRDWRRLGKRW